MMLRVKKYCPLDDAYPDTLWTYELTLSSSRELTAFFRTWALVPEQLDRARYLLPYLGCGVLAALTQGYFGMFSDIPS
ncbi:hypothetical protein Lepto7375DRAFT_1318 [Leptolyngbya sp. PCC 7375]|nr:hypothetical protein Lepto7375DRAFT_1318 [Leptolyngbya sp. PCC 7375]